MNFNLFTMVYGSHYVELFKRACFRSMNWPLNQETVRGRIWNIYTKHEHFEEFKEIFKDSVFKLQLFPITDTLSISGCGLVKTSQCDAGVILLCGLRHQIMYSIQNASRMLLAPPDTIFGDGTIANLLKIGSGQQTCVAVAHPRVLPGILDEIDLLGATRGSLSNASLVTLAMKHAHDSWEGCEVGNPKMMNLLGGISWKSLEPGLYSVQHRLPTHYLCDFNESDWNFWWSMSSFGAFDHRWPAENIIRQERQRYVGSSDSCFIVEVTEWDKNVPPEFDKSLLNGSIPLEDACVFGNYHNAINRQFSVIWRGE